MSTTSGPESLAVDRFGLAAAGAIDLSAWLAGFTAPMSRRQPYREPTPAEAADALAGLHRLFGGGDAAALLAPLGFTVVSGLDSLSERPFVLAFSEAPPGDRAWAAMLLDSSAPVRTVIGCPHPVFDATSEQLGLSLWQRMPGALLLVAGAHRDAGPGGLADPRDHPGSLFHQYAAAMLEVGLPHIQLHGFADSSAEGIDVVLSPGATTPGTPIVRAGDSLTAHGLLVARAWETPVPGLGGTTNIQGRAALAAGAIFLHVEASRTARDEPGRRRGIIDGLVGADVAGTGARGPILGQAVDGQIPGSVGALNTVGTSRYAARADHRHAERQATVERVAALEADRQRTAEKDRPSGYPGLSASGRLDPARLPLADPPVILTPSEAGRIDPVGLPVADQPVVAAASSVGGLAPAGLPVDPPLVVGPSASAWLDPARLPVADQPVVVGPSASGRLDLAGTLVADRSVVGSAVGVTPSLTVTVDHSVGWSFAVSTAGVVEVAMSSAEAPADGAAVLLEVFADGGGVSVTFAASTTLLAGLVPPFAVAAGRIGLFGLRFSARADRWVVVSAGVEQ